ncbi:sterol desaturase family protein [Robiginitomaculum antarcticum]|uniref:sterol desaturase family protein n=1 Tax=Robiginitomaculum antarcticum TaxID=437507 RepID=UPI00035D7D87|nr:sterol desaturase family protein [Robiginitomaculum antarcticum]
MNEPGFPDILLWAIPFFIVCVVAEWLIIRRRAAYNWKDGFASMAMGLGMTVSDIIAKLTGLAILLWLWQFRFFDLGIGLPVIIIAFIIGDFKYYWSHRLAHRVRWWWMAHIVHHSSEHYNLTTALRQPWTNHISGAIIISVPMVLLGFHPFLVAFVGALNLLYQFWIHTEVIKKMPRWFEFIFNTPSHHRVHHGRNPEYLDTNYAGTLIIWDKMFGTFVPEAQRPDYGVVKKIETYNPVTIAFAELVQIFKDAFMPDLKLSERLKYIFAPPGYSHDGSRQTSAQIKAQAARTNLSPAE